MAEPFSLFNSLLLKLQEESSLVHPRQNRFDDTQRQAMRTRINVILQRRVTLKTDTRRFQTLIRTYTNFIESKLMNSANSEEEYSNPRDLEVRIHYLDKEVLEQYLPRLRATRASRVLLSELPDSLIAHILLFLPTKDSIKTSFLSKRFKNIWLEVPGLELHSRDLSLSPAIKNYIDRFLHTNRHSRLHKLKIKYDDECNNVYLYGISHLIAQVIRRGVHELDIGTLKRPLPKDLMHEAIYRSNTLVSLKLANVGMPNHPGFVASLPCLKTMHLEYVLYSNEDPLIIEKLISGCPVLEDLTICRVFDDNVPLLRVRSQSLKRFCVMFGRYKRVLGKVYAVEIDAPGLKYMNFRDDQSDRVVVKNLTSLFMVDIDTQFSASTLQMKKAIIGDFLKGVSGVTNMIISQPTLEVYYSCLKQGPPFTKFRNLSRLEASFCTVLLQMLPHFLEAFPNLKHLTLNLLYLKELEPENLELAVVPRCLLRTLECVEVKEVITTVKNAGRKRARYIKRTKVGKHKKKIWIEVVRYILENSLVLKKLVLCFSPVTDSVLDISEALPTFTIRSPRCEIFNLLTSR